MYLNLGWQLCYAHILASKLLTCVHGHACFCCCAVQKEDKPSKPDHKKPRISLGMFGGAQPFQAGP